MPRESQATSQLQSRLPPVPLRTLPATLADKRTTTRHPTPRRSGGEKASEEGERARKANKIVKARARRDARRLATPEELLWRRSGGRRRSCCGGGKGQEGDPIFNQAASGARRGQPRPGGGPNHRRAAATNAAPHRGVGRKMKRRLIREVATAIKQYGDGWAWSSKRPQAKLSINPVPPYYCAKCATSGCEGSIYRCIARHQGLSPVTHPWPRTQVDRWAAGILIERL